MAHDVFISYASEDKPVADMICAVAERHGVRCWMAPRDIAPGADWRESILAAIRASRAMVLVFSGHANASRHVNREVDCAIEAAIPVVPFRTEAVGPSGSLEYSLYGVHWLDAMTPPLEAHTTRLADLLKSIVSSRAAAGDSVSVKDAPRIPDRTATREPRKNLSREVIVAGSVVVLAAIVGVWLWLGRNVGETGGSTTTTPTPVTSSRPTLTPAPSSAPGTTPAGTPTVAATPSGPRPVAPAAELVNSTPPNSAVVFQTPQGELVWSIKPDRANDFEQSWVQIVDGLRRSDQPQARQLAHTINLFKLPPAATAMYMVRIDPAVSTIDYSPRHLLTMGRFDAQTADALYRRIFDSVAQIRTLQLEPLDLVPAGVTLRPAPGPSNTTRVPGGDEFTFSVDEAEIWWQVKPGQRENLESVFREILPGLYRSNNPYVRQMARGIKAFHVVGTDLVIFRLDPVAKGMSYSPGVLMQSSGTFSADLTSTLMERMTAAISQVTVMSLTPVR